MNSGKHPIRDVIFDRDGTIIVDKHYLSDPDDVELLPGAPEALARLHAAGIRIHIASNQSGIGRGYFKDSDHHSVSDRLLDMLRKHGVTVHSAMYCPHAPEEACECRKPGPGMWRELQAACDVRPESTAVVGDKASDTAFGAAFGAALVVLVLTGKGRDVAVKLGLPAEMKHAEFVQDEGASKRAVAVDAAAACDLILHWNAEAGAAEHA